MKSITLSFIALAFSLTGIKAQSIEGIWWSPKKDGKIEVYYHPDGHYEGKLIWTSNPAPKNQAMVGTLILREIIKAGDNEYKGNTFDPTDNITYECTVSLADENTLKLHGYVGVALLGKTEEFTRVID